MHRSSAALAALAAVMLLASRSGPAWSSPAARPARREIFAASFLPLVVASQQASAESEKVVVLGGSGFVGSRICEQLAAKGVSVVSVSRSGAPPAKAGAWAQKVEWVKGDVLSMDLSSTVSGASAVVSAIGSIGTPDDAKFNGETAEKAVAAAKDANVPRFVLVSATPLVSEAGLGSVFPGYIEGKKRAEAAVASFPGKTLVMQPTFIYGGDEFMLNPPRVAGGYGQLVEGVLGTGLVRGVASISPAPVKLALLPPSAVEDVAAAAVAGAEGRATGILGTHDDIKNAASR